MFYSSVILTDNLHHSSPRPLHLTTGSAVPTAILLQSAEDQAIYFKVNNRLFITTLKEGAANIFLRLKDKSNEHSTAQRNFKVKQPERS
jgi:hypothetical protein